MRKKSLIQINFIDIIALNKNFFNIKKEIGKNFFNGKKLLFNPKQCK